LKDESQISAQDILGIANDVSQARDRDRGLALLKYICQCPSVLSSTVNHNTLGAALQDIPWVPCASERPTSLPWYGRSNVLYCSKDVKLIEMANLLRSVAPLVRVGRCHSEFRNFFGCTSDVNLVFIDLAIKHLRNVSRSKQLGEHLDSVFAIVSSIYSYLGKVSEDLLLPILSAYEIIASEAWVWHGKGFTTSDKIAFSIVVPVSNLRSYIHVVPHGLYQYKAFLIRLGVRQSFTIQDYVNVLGAVTESVESNLLSDQNMTIVHDIKALLKCEDIEAVQSQIVIPDSNSVLRSIEDLTYIDQMPTYPSGEFTCTS
jgi:hypothetical protein